ncbi:MAG TPA: putative nucleotidyltransferase substrate binding domain-containing protein [Actinoplanes sp.]|nr:putative nucleotidyltransferase substrate binding domain-containing protein [Actinoplanes sp.]
MQEFADFLAGQPPFDALTAEDMARLVTRVEVEYFAAGAVVVEGAERLRHLWVVRTGALEVVDRGQVVDLLGVGDTFGHLWLLADLPPRLTVRAHEDSLCLRIPDPRTFLAHPERLRFAALDTVPRWEPLAGPAVHAGDRRLAEVMRPIVWCEAGETIRDAAERIGAAGTSCALVRTADGLGIVTDHDFRRRVATGLAGVDELVARVASVPALTIDEDATQAAGLLRMVEHGVHHLVVTDQSERPVGVVRVVDLAAAEVRDPLLVRSAIEGAASAEELARAARLLPTTIVELCETGVAPAHIGAVHAAVVDAVLRRALDLRADPVLAEVPHSWVLLGSLARYEPLPLSDVDTALVWADPPESGPDPAADIRAAAREVLRVLERSGLTLCANGANAHNPLFSRSRSGWAAAARAWQRDPTQENALLLSAMVADSRPVTNLPLGRALTAQIRSHTRTKQFLRALLDEALGWRPPTGFVRDFVVVQGGKHSGRLDLKSGGLMPVVALARWIAIASGDARGTTTARLRRGAEEGLLTTDEADTLAGGFDAGYGLLLRHQARAIRDGVPPTRYVAPADLDTLTRRHLRESFRAVALVQARVDRDWMRRLDR